MWAKNVESREFTGREFEGREYGEGNVGEGMWRRECGSLR